MARRTKDLIHQSAVEVFGRRPRTRGQHKKARIPVIKAMVSQEATA
ncbi:hypothetical protein [Kyrpidia tusciae]|nr:hypothetical protein [Kyrpidia tusciae]